MPQPACISLTRLAITNGMMHSRTTSPTTRIGVRIAGFLNSRMLLLSVLIIPENSSYPNSWSLPRAISAAPRRIRLSRGAGSRPEFIKQILTKMRRLQTATFGFSLCFISEPGKLFCRLQRAVGSAEILDHPIQKVVELGNFHAGHIADQPLLRCGQLIEDLLVGFLCPLCDKDLLAPPVLRGWFAGSDSPSPPAAAAAQIPWDG